MLVMLTLIVLIVMLMIILVIFTMTTIISALIYDDDDHDVVEEDGHIGNKAAMMTTPTMPRAVHVTLTRALLELHLLPPRTPLTPLAVLAALTGVDCSRGYCASLRGIGRAEYNSPIGRQALSATGVDLGGPRVFLGSPAFLRARSRPSGHGWLGLPPLRRLGGDEHGVYAHGCYGGRATAVRVWAADTRCKLLPLTVSTNRRK